MQVNTFRFNVVDRSQKMINNAYQEIMVEHDNYELGLKRVDHYLKRVAKRVGVYRYGRKNALYSK